MAVKTATITPLDTIDGRNVTMIQWATMANGDTGEPVEMPALGDRSVQVYGTFGVGGNLRIEGSNHPTAGTYATLNDPSSTALNITTAGIEQVLEVTRWIRPNATAGDGTTALTVIMLVRKG